MTAAASAHLRHFIPDPSPSGCVKEQFNASLRPYGAGWCLPRHGEGGHGRPAGAPVGEGQRSAANNFADAGAGPDWLCGMGYPAVLLVFMASAPAIMGADGGLARKTSISPTSSIIPSNGLVARESAIRRSPARRPSVVCRTSRTIRKTRAPPN